MPPKPKPGGREPKISIEFAFTPNEWAHVFFAIANLQAYRSQDEGESILSPTHPVVQIQNVIVEQTIHLIGTGVTNGWNVTELIKLQNALNQAMEDRNHED